MTLHDLQSLISYGHPTSDNVMLMYIKLISKHNKIPYLNMDFILRLTNNGWHDVVQYFSTSSHRKRLRHLNRLNVTGEDVIMIPTYVNESHVLALVHHEIINIVFFLHTDDTNNPNTEQELKRIITTQTNAKIHSTYHILIMWASHFACSSHYDHPSQP